MVFVISLLIFKCGLVSQRENMKLLQKKSQKPSKKNGMFNDYYICYCMICRKIENVNYDVIPNIIVHNTS